MISSDIRNKFLEYFKKNGHTIVPSSSLIPDDPSVLLTTAGMQQFKPYYSKLNPETTIHPSIGKPVGKNAASVQKCFRTSDIDEVGDESHLTFFEMLGNFSFGGYFKKEAIRYAHEFITSKEWMALDIEYVTIFDSAKVPVDNWRKSVPFDEESHRIWKEEIGLPEEKIRREGIDNFWGPTGQEGPCGPTTEIYVKTKGGKEIEVWNIVFNEFYAKPRTNAEPTRIDTEKELTPLEVNGIDTGMGLERLVMVSQGASTIFDTDLFESTMRILPPTMDTRTKRIFADHARAIVFLISDGLRPLNKDAGYILRRLMRRLIVYGIPNTKDILRDIVSTYKNFYNELDEKVVGTVFSEENEKFSHALRKGLTELGKMEKIDAKSAFKLYESFGLPYEVIKEKGEGRAVMLTREDFDKELEKHRAISRAGQEKKFGGHGLLLHTGELKAANEEEVKIVTRLHTATHLLQAALRKVLGPEIKQAGSDITAERTRFDFTFGRKLTPEEIAQVEKIINDVVKANYRVIMEEMAYKDAVKEGVLGFFKEKYPEWVSVYSIVDEAGQGFSRELCGGPHVKNTGEIGMVKIIKEEAVGAGVRRIRAIVESIPQK